MTYHILAMQRRKVDPSAGNNPPAWRQPSSADRSNHASLATRLAPGPHNSARLVGYIRTMRRPEFVPHLPMRTTPLTPSPPNRTPHPNRRAEWKRETPSFRPLVLICHDWIITKIIQIIHVPSRRRVGVECLPPRSESDWNRPLAYTNLMSSRLNNDYTLVQQIWPILRLKNFAFFFLFLFKTSLLTYVSNLSPHPPSHNDAHMYMHTATRYSSQEIASIRASLPCYTVNYIITMD